MELEEEIACKLTSKDGELVACFGALLDMGHLSAWVSIHELKTGKETQKFEIFEGISNFEPQFWQPGFDQANQFLREKEFDLRAKTTGDGRTATITKDGKVEVQGMGMSGQAALPPIPEEGPTDKLAKNAKKCCKWEVSEAYFVPDQTHALVTLLRDCGWNRPGTKGVSWQCSDKLYSEENNYEVVEHVSAPLLPAELGDGGPLSGGPETCDPKWKQMKGCPKIHKPVCVEVFDPSIRCVRAPCPQVTRKQFGNDCMACQAGHSNYHDKRCNQL